MKRSTKARWAWLAGWGSVICGGCGAVEYQVSIAALREAAALPAEQQARAAIPAYSLTENAKLTYVRYGNVSGPEVPTSFDPSLRSLLDQHRREGYRWMRNRGRNVPARPATGVVLIALGAGHLVMGAGLLGAGVASQVYNKGESAPFILSIPLHIIGLSLFIPGVRCLQLRSSALEVLPDEPRLLYYAPPP